MAYADYSFYISTYLGSSIAESDFSRWAMRASVEIDKVTFERAAGVISAGENDDQIEKIKLATCAVADELKKLDDSGGALSSERVGNVSVTYLSQKSEDARLKKAAKLFLWNTGLMYSGLEIEV